MSSATSKLPFIEILEWVEHNPNVMMWKVPDGDKEIKNGAKLIVRESQQVMFMNEGTIADVLMHGTHTLSTQNVPILSRLKGWKYGFESPFKADVYFFSVKQFVNLKWGTPAPILLTDPKFGQVRIRAFGSYNVRIVDVPRFFKEYAGTYPELTIFEFQQQLRDFIAPKFAEALALSQIPLVEVARNLSQLNAQIEPLIAPYFQDFGIVITQFTVTSVTLPEEVTGYYDKVTGMNMLGDNMDKFQQFNTAIAISKDGNMAQQGAQQGAAMGILLKEMNQSTEAKEPPVEGDLRGKLQQIKVLFDEGLIDEQEYKEKKAALLSKL
ncbi:SPFH domain-containing protein [Sphingobacterium phlebotomi]|uniref:SPFH domain-containing protein n=1 Tax=Sphingobacterium phlebotomi TaxID=2605433 RepID=A0A5D4H114_9SPHI|nr:SPFH domain-containing protein [Sphingobacterium phlebotomi]TYR34731.1 SPFH domain-containing protein [Sphingobacterium phlebotomi]